MGSLGDSGDAAETNKPVEEILDYDGVDADFLHTGTQPFVSNDDKGGVAYEVLGESTAPFDDAIGTQLVDVARETQALEDPGYFNDLGTQLVDEFDDEVVLDSGGEETERTEIMGLGDDLSDDDSGSSGKCEALDGDSLSKRNEDGLMEQPNDFSDEQRSSSCANLACISGVLVPTEEAVAQVSPKPKPRSGPRFTSIRVKSLQASGLAARERALKRINSNSFSILTNSETSKELTAKSNGCETKFWEEDEVVHDRGRYHDEGNAVGNENRCKVASSTVRKLFIEGSFVENEGLTDNSHDVGGKEVLELPPCDELLAGLSYVDSQEPGESSQANAFACVQRLIAENKALFDNDGDWGKSSMGKLTHISKVKGPQCLAKKAHDRRTDRKSGTFDWDDTREDDGGGEIFRRKKEEFFGEANRRQRSLTEPQKLKGNRRDGCRGSVGKSTLQNDITVHSDSKIKVPKLNEKTLLESQMNSRKNLLDDFDGEADANVSAKQLDTATTSEDIPDMPNVGLDTQMAAEAMEALFNGETICHSNANDSHPGQPGSLKDSPKGSSRQKAKKSVRSEKCSSKNIGVSTRSMKAERSGARSSKQAFGWKDSETGLVMTRRKRVRLYAEEQLTAYERTVVNKMSSQIFEGSKEGIIQRSQFDECDRGNGTSLRIGGSTKRRQSPEELAMSTPIAQRIRRSLVVSQPKGSENIVASGREEAHHPIEENRVDTVCAGASKRSRVTGKSSELGCNPSGEQEICRPMIDSLSCPKGAQGRRARRSLSGQLNETGNKDVKSNLSGLQGCDVKSTGGQKRLQSHARITVTELNKRRKQSAMFPSKGDTEIRSIDKPCSGDAAPNCTSANLDGNTSEGLLATEGARHSDNKASAGFSPSGGSKTTLHSDKSPRQITKPSEFPSSSPINCVTPANDASPVCIGSGYKHSSTKSPFKSLLKRELNSLCEKGPDPVFSPKDSRKRRDLANVRVLFSHHLDEDVIRQQTKIAERLKVSVVTSITDATHFITDEFVRTRNMLEAIASGKPVVTHLWLENVGCANYYIDEHNYILRDIKKEKELSFNMPASLSIARQRPLLRGRKVFVTPQTNPGKEIILGLVKAVHGQAAERVGRSAFKDGMVPDDLLVLSCEEDYDLCVPFLEKGAAVYSSELLLNGIVTQRLEYARHRLFADHVKKTRSTIWLKKDDRGFIPVTQRK